jgi:hypothetical protein
MTRGTNPQTMIGRAPCSWNNDSPHAEMSITSSDTESDIESRHRGLRTDTMSYSPILQR